MAGSASRTLEPYARSLLRIVAGFTFSLHGMQKLFGSFGGMGGSGARAHFMTLPWVAACIELAGGLLLLIGLFASLAAFIASGEMAVAYFMMHQPRGPLPLVNGGETAVLYCFIFLYIAAAGAGPLSVDALARKKAG
jgi:putative oxidoreductase